MRHIFFIFVSAFIVLAEFLVGGAQATTYVYTGPHFTIVKVPYDTSMSITGNFTTAAPLPPNMPLTDIGPNGSNLVTSWYFFDGVNNVTNSNSVPTPPAGSTFEVGTDASGNINTFRIQLEAPLPPHTVGETIIVALTMETTSPQISQSNYLLNCLGVTNIDGINVCSSWGPASGYGQGPNFTPGSFAATSLQAPTLVKSFSPTSVAIGGQSTLTFTVTNPNSTGLSQVAFSDNLPDGVVISTPNGFAGSSCFNAVVTADAGSSSVGMTGALLHAGESCTFNVNVTGTTPGSKVNTTGNVSSAESGPGGTATATLAVGTTPPPAPVTPVPTLSEWGMLIFIILAGLGSFYVLGRRKSRV